MSPYEARYRIWEGPIERATRLLVAEGAKAIKATSQTIGPSHRLGLWIDCLDIKWFAPWEGELQCTYKLCVGRFVRKVLTWRVLDRSLHKYMSLRECQHIRSWQHRMMQNRRGLLRQCPNIKIFVRRYVKSFWNTVPTVQRLTQRMKFLQIAERLRLSDYQEHQLINTSRIELIIVKVNSLPAESTSAI